MTEISILEDLKSLENQLELKLQKTQKDSEIRLQEAEKRGGLKWKEKNV